MISMEWDKLRSSDSFLLMNNFTDSYESVNRAKNRWLNPTDGVIKLCLFSLICTVQVLHLNSNKSFVLNICYVVFLSSGLLRKGLYLCCFWVFQSQQQHDLSASWCWTHPVMLIFFSDSVLVSSHSGLDSAPSPSSICSRSSSSLSCLELTVAWTSYHSYSFLLNHLQLQYQNWKIFEL